METVNAWIEEIILPTYETGEPEKNPIFLEKRVYQGSSGAVYPLPVVEIISAVKTEKKYKAVFLENAYLKIIILPELGGRVHRAFDKIRQRDFVYYNQVVKPALVGLTGPWISGGIEFNWPQHHRPSTFLPVDFTIAQNEDGSKTVWVNEVERMTRTKGMAGFTLYPNKAYLEIKGRIFNRTPFAQTFLWWANPAVKVNDHYQSVFPPDVFAVFDHGKRDVSDFPIATGTYYKVNYAPGTDISMYKNIPVPTSYMAIQSKYNFIGGYEHDTQAGMVHVANHHIVPGKKQWTWGNGAFGKAWDDNLTDEDGPYIELMCGVFTDNQPDFAWLQPNEEKTFEQYFMPYAAVGMVKNATKEAAINIERETNGIGVKLYTTAQYDDVKITVVSSFRLLSEFEIDVSPEKPFIGSIPAEVAADELLSVKVCDRQGKLLVDYAEEAPVSTEIPPAATPAPQPEDVATVEQLFLHGHHIEQYRHATYSAIHYYAEALKREPTDFRCNNAMGLYWLKKGQYGKAEPYFRQAVKTATCRNPNPYDGEPYYNLGICLNALGNTTEAYDSFYKAIWNDAWQHAGFLQIAQLDIKKNDYESALTHISQSLVKNYHSHKARHIKTIVLRKLGRVNEAKQLIEDSIKIDPFNYGCLFEGVLLDDAPNSSSLPELMRLDWNNFIEYALDFAHCGCYKEASQLIHLLLVKKDEQPALLWYYQAWLLQLSGDKEEASNTLQIAAKADIAVAFPNKLEDITVLQWATETNPTDAKAFYLLGNIWYAFGQYTEAIDAWEKAVIHNPNFATPYRNLALAYHNMRNDENRALNNMETAFSLDSSDSRVLMELDQLKKKMNTSPAERLKFLLHHKQVAMQRDDIYLEMVTIYNMHGEYEVALDLLGKRKFSPWEGGEGKTVGQFLLAVIEMAKEAISAGKYQQALDWLAKTEVYPANLGEGKLYGTQENDIRFLKGIALDGLGFTMEASTYFQSATEGNSAPVQAIFYNDPQPDKIVYQALAWLRLGHPEKATEIADGLIDFGKIHENDNIRIDYFAVSLPDLLVFNQDLNKKNHLHCLYLQALGYLALGEKTTASYFFSRVLEADVNHTGARVHQQLLKQTFILDNTKSAE